MLFLALRKVLMVKNTLPQFHGKISHPLPLVGFPPPLNTIWKTLLGADKFLELDSFSDIFQQKFDANSAASFVGHLFLR